MSDIEIELLDYFYIFDNGKSNLKIKIISFNLMKWC